MKAGFLNSLICILLIMLIIPGMIPGMASAIEENLGDSGSSASHSGSTDTGNSVSDSGSSDNGDSGSDSGNLYSGSDSDNGDSDFSSNRGNSTPISPIVIHKNSNSNSGHSGSSSDSTDSDSGSSKKASDSSSKKSVTESDTGNSDTKSSDTVSSSSRDSDTQNLDNTNSDAKSSDTGNQSYNTSSDNSSSSNNSSSSDDSGMTLVSSEPASNIAFKELSTRSIIGGYHVRYDFVENVTCITHIEFDPIKTFRKTTTTVQELKNKSTLVSTSCPGTVYKYVNIWVGDEGAGLPTSLKNGSVGFRVEKAWIKDNDIDEDGITLQRYDESWTALKTETVREDQNYVYFEAETPGYSFFAITDNGNAKEIHGAEKIHETLKNLGDKGKAALSGKSGNSRIKNPMGLARTIMAVSFPLFMVIVGYGIFKRKL